MNDQRPNFSRGLMVRRSLIFYRGSMILLALGVAAATAVIVGALLVGDSVRGSLRGLVVDRLARVEQVLLAPRFITQGSAVRLGNADKYPHDFDPPIPAILFPKSSAEYSKESRTHRASSILVAGIEDSFWQMQDGEKPASLKGRQVILNQTLADELNAKVGDEIALRLPVEQAVSADSPLGRSEELTQGLPRLKVVSILPNQGLGQFDLRTSQKPPRNAYVPLELIQTTLDRPDQINAIFVARKSSAPASRAQDLPMAKKIADELSEAAGFSLEDLGIRVERVTKKSGGPEGKLVYDYYHITSDQLLIPPGYVEAIEAKLGPQGSQAVLTYLANKLQKIVEGKPTERLATYSTVSAVEIGPTFNFQGVLGSPDGPKVVAPKDADASNVSKGQYLDSEFRLSKGEVIVNQWLSERLELRVGDMLRMDYYLPEKVQGKEVESTWEGKVVGIAPLTEPSTEWSGDRPPLFQNPPTLFNDSNLTPEVPGITDQESMDQWDLPFATKLKVSKEDDQYWKRHRLTPKAYLSVDDGATHFGSRFGKVSSIRVPIQAAESIEALEATLLPELRKAAKSQGLTPIPLRAQQLAAASGTTPFDALFLSLSFFVIIAALILVSLLFRLGVEQRAEQWGLLLSLGWQRWQVRRLLLREGFFVSIAGGMVGVLLGFGYAQAMMWGLSGWWLGAVSVPFLSFHATTLSVLIGCLLGVFAAWGTIFWASMSLRKVEPLRLLRGRFEDSDKKTISQNHVKGRVSQWFAAASFIVGVGLIPVGWMLTGEEQAGAYLGTGMLFLIGGLLFFFRRMKARSLSRTALDSITFGGLASRSATRNPLRSSLAVGLIAFSSFLVLAISLFQAQPTKRAAGGFDWMAESSQTIPTELGDEAYQRLVLGPKQSVLKDVAIESFRLRPGDDASCNNLYQALQPRILGIPAHFAAREARQENEKRFPWAGHATPQSNSEEESNFALLERPGDGTQQAPYPVVLDMNTAMWSLHRGVSIGEIFSFEFEGKEIHFQTVGLLKNSLLQGYLVLGEKNFVSAFPEISGYQYFLIGSDSTKGAKVSEILEEGWGDEGLDVGTTASILRQLLGVQNTYLSAFQALGALGLLLGTFGLAVAQTRSVVERRSEIALLQSLGFSRHRVNQLLMSENGWLLLVGVALGGSCAIAAIAPAWAGGQSIANSLWPMAMLGVILGCGWVSGYLAVYRANRMRLLDSLRGK